MLLDPQANEPYELGAKLLTILAYPELAAGRRTVDDGGKGGSIRENSAWLCGQGVRAIAESLDGSDRWAPTPIRLGYLPMTWKKTTRKESMFQRRLRNRMIAARMALPLLQKIEGVTRSYPKSLRTEMKGVRPTVNELAHWIAWDDHVWERYNMAGRLRNSGDREPSNIKSRMWRPTLRVLPLAAALDAACEAYERRHPKLARSHPFHVGWLMTLPSARAVQDYIVHRALQLEPIVEGLGEFGIEVPELVRVRLA